MVINVVSVSLLVLVGIFFVPGLFSVAPWLGFVPPAILLSASEYSRSKAGNTSQGMERLAIVMLSVVLALPILGILGFLLFHMF